MIFKFKIIIIIIRWYLKRYYLMIFIWCYYLVSKNFSRIHSTFETSRRRSRFRSCLSSRAASMLCDTHFFTRVCLRYVPEEKKWRWRGSNPPPLEWQSSMLTARPRHARRRFAPKAINNICMKLAKIAF